MDAYSFNTLYNAGLNALRSGDIPLCKLCIYLVVNSSFKSWKELCDPQDVYSKEILYIRSLKKFLYKRPKYFCTPIQSPEVFFNDQKNQTISKMYNYFFNTDEDLLVFLPNMSNSETLKCISIDSIDSPKFGEFIRRYGITFMDLQRSGHLDVQHLYAISSKYSGDLIFDIPEINIFGRDIKINNYVKTNIHRIYMYEFVWIIINMYSDYIGTIHNSLSELLVDIAAYNKDIFLFDIFRPDLRHFGLYECINHCWFRGIDYMHDELDPIRVEEYLLSRVPDLQGKYYYESYLGKHTPWKTYIKRSERLTDISFILRD